MNVFLLPLFDVVIVVVVFMCIQHKKVLSLRKNSRQLLTLVYFPKNDFGWFSVAAIWLVGGFVGLECGEGERIPKCVLTPKLQQNTKKVSHLDFLLCVNEWWWFYWFYLLLAWRSNKTGGLHIPSAYKLSYYLQNVLRKSLRCKIYRNIKIKL